MPVFEETGKKFKKYILAIVTGAVVLTGYLFFGQKIDVATIASGDVSAAGQALEDAANAP